MCVITRAESLSLSPKMRTRSGPGGAAGRAVEFCCGDGIVFVDDRDDAELKQRGQRGAKIFVPARIEKIVFGEEHLGDAIAQLIEGIVVHAHQAALADGGAGLHERELGRTRRELEALHAQTDGAGGDEQDFAPRAAEIGERLGDAVEGRRWRRRHHRA